MDDLTDNGHVCLNYLILEWLMFWAIILLVLSTTFFADVQLKPHHVPFEVRKYWRQVLNKFNCVTAESAETDEPRLLYRRNVLLSRTCERTVRVAAAFCPLAKIAYE